MRNGNSIGQYTGKNTRANKDVQDCKPLSFIRKYKKEKEIKESINLGKFLLEQYDNVRFNMINYKSNVLDEIIGKEVSTVERVTFNAINRYARILQESMEKEKLLSSMGSEERGIQFNEVNQQAKILQRTIEREKLLTSDEAENNIVEFNKINYRDAILNECIGCQLGEYESKQFNRVNTASMQMNAIINNVLIGERNE